MTQICYQIPELLHVPQLEHGVSTVSDGNLSYKWGEKNDVLTNRTNFLSKLSLELNDCVALSTRDSDIAVIVSSNDRSKGMTNIDDAIPGDALITTDTSIALFLLTADCLPIIYFDPNNNVLALAHLSWKATE